mmetsp:Transcript_115944/g.231135  ORF Transcript_115944/g.231135 Transcript_115944/m.231135 type:complete len:384 (-) Transcript_115944:23-1174(-)
MFPGAARHHPLQEQTSMQPSAEIIHEFDVEGTDWDSSSAIDSDDLAQQEQRLVGWRFLMVGIGLVLLALACWLGFALQDGGHRSISSHLKESQITRKSSVLNQEDQNRTSPGLATHAPTQVLEEATIAATTTPQLEGLAVARPSLTDLSEDLHDGNVCKSDEELYAGLCYRKCSLLTGGMDSIRTSPWTCCHGKPCTINQKLETGFRVACAGFAVAGDGSSCPHLPGACLPSEELLLGVCYKKCGLLTNHAYPNRVAPATCCKSSGLSCMLFPWRRYTSAEFNTGGGRDEPGACFKDEEMFLGTCYKKCGLLTEEQYPHRLGPFTCCKAYQTMPHIDRGVWHMGCLDLRKHKSRPSFAVTGNRTRVDYDSAHFPLQQLTEAVS